ncbi:MAG: hypothetical protein OXH79_06130 [Boseongicola sp.]|nr:hypothetical protein [Boseongicola sp.]
MPDQLPDHVTADAEPVRSLGQGQDLVASADRARRTRRGHGAKQLRHSGGVEVAGTKLANCNLFVNQAGHVTKAVDRVRGVAEALKFGEKPVPVRGQPVV